MTKVSILIPCYNAERWIGEAIQSALDQTHQDKEIIVVDDGSTDQSLNVIKSFGEQIHWKTGPNQGGNIARNRLLQLASGQWIQYLDADDYLLPSKVSSQIASIEGAEPPDMIYSPPIIETWQDGELVDQTVGNHATDTTIETEWLHWRVAQTGTMLWQKNSLASIGGWNEAFTRCQDNELTLRAIKNGLKIKHNAKPAAVYRIWSDNTVCRRNPSLTIKVKTHLVEEMMTWITSQGCDSKPTSEAASQAFFEMARLLATEDLNAATHYARRFQRKGLFTPCGPAAPALYRIAHRILGFELTEIIARRRRL